MSKDVQQQQTLATANMVSQVGCVTAFAAIFIIALAFGIGWFIDDLMGNERKFATVFMLLASFPVTLYVMVRISLWIVGKTQRQIVQTDHDNDQINHENKEEITA